MQTALLEKIDQSLILNRESLRIKGLLQLTKSQRAYCDAHLIRDFALERSVDHRITERTSFENLITKYAVRSELEISHDKPRHYAMRILGGSGAICSGKNIFLFFPQCLGLEPIPGQEVFGLELIDVWRNVFERVVFPCARIILSHTSLVDSVPQLLGSIERTIYLASIFHEVGHRNGAWRVSPLPDPRLKVSAFHLDIMGELATDSYLVSCLQEFPEIALFVTLQRLFWFGRRGFLDNPRSANINEDNDSWLTAYLWNQLVEEEVLTQSGNRWHLRSTRLPEFYRKLCCEVEELGQLVLTVLTEEEQNEIVAKWMKRKVEWNSDEGFILPSALRQAFNKCSRFPEIPQFEPILDLNHEEEPA